MSKRIALLLLLLLFAGLFGTGSLAAGENITDWLTEYLTTDVASVAIFELEGDHDAAGELLYNDQSGELQYVRSPEESAAVVSVSLVDSDDTQQRREDESSEESGEEETTVPDGYVHVYLQLNGLDDYDACMDAQYAQSPAQRAAQRAAEEETQAETTETESSTENAETEERESVVAFAAEAESAAAETAVTEPTAEESSKKTSRNKDVLFILILLTAFAAIAGEFALILTFRSRAENVATNYIRTRAALDKTKKELSLEKSKNLQLERQLMQEQKRMSAVREQVEKLDGKHSAESRKSEPERRAEKREKKKLEYDLDYLDWM